MQRYENAEPKFVKEFIELYKSFPCLWHQQSKQYEHEKQKAYEALVQKYREVDPQATKETVERKINTLRTSYRKQLRRLQRSSKAGTNRQPTWWYFELFSFLDDYPKWLKQDDLAQSAHSESLDDEYDDDTVENDGTRVVEEFYITPQPLTAQQTESCSDQSHLRSQSLVTLPHDLDLEELVQQQLNAFFQNEPSVVYGKHVAHKLRSLTDQQNKFAQKLINDIIFEAEMGSLTRHCTLVGMESNELDMMDEEVATQHTTHSK
uniref:MADF domain-containing protein n=1 Tax=Anopheles funestus TaxID=62324 RepID=A0A182RXR4_ANOFN